MLVCLSVCLSARRITENWPEFHEAWCSMGVAWAKERTHEIWVGIRRGEQTPDTNPPDLVQCNFVYFPIKSNPTKDGDKSQLPSSVNPIL